MITSGLRLLTESVITNTKQKSSQLRNFSGSFEKNATGRKNNCLHAILIVFEPVKIGQMKFCVYSGSWVTSMLLKPLFHWTGYLMLSLISIQRMLVMCQWQC